MGTRNYIKVTVNNELKVCQYGQWDGYPSIVGEKVLEFIKNVDLNRFRDIMLKCTLSVADDNRSITSTGAPITEKLMEIFDFYNEAAYRDYTTKTAAEARKVADAATLEKYGEESFMQYKIADRDTGVELLSLLMKFGPQKLYCLSGNERDADVQGIYHIDMDKNCVEMQFNGKKKVVLFNELSDMNIEKEMTAFEAECE